MPVSLEQRETERGHRMVEREVQFKFEKVENEFKSLLEA